jgi:hypothetical protein
MTFPAAAAQPAAGAPCRDEPSHVKALFFVTGVADPGLLPRLIEPVAKLGHVPLRVHASRESGDGTEVSVDLRLVDLPPRAALLVEHALRSVVGVRQVIAVVEPQA